MFTSRESIAGLLRGDSFTRVGLTEFLWLDTLARWVREGYPTRKVFKNVGQKRWRRDDGQWVDVEVAGEYVEPVPAWKHFGYDMIGAGPWLDQMPVRDFEEIIEETDEWKIVRNGAGADRKFWKHKMGTPEHIHFRMLTREIWERDYRPLLLDLDPERVDVPEMQINVTEIRAADIWMHYGHMFVWELMRQSMGDVTMYESLLLDPDWIHDYNRVYTDFYRQHFAYMFEHVGKPDGIWLYEDLGYKNGLFASPRTLAELIFPYYAELVAFFHSYDLPVILHSCGSQVQALPLVVEAGFDGLNPMERKAKGNNPLSFAEEYSDALVFVGGLDVRILETNDRAVIQREVSQYIEGMKARGARLVFASDHSVTPNVSYDSYRYALDVYRDHMMY